MSIRGLLLNLLPLVVGSYLAGRVVGLIYGATINDISADLAQGVITPEEAAAQVQESWDFR